MNLRAQTGRDRLFSRIETTHVMLLLALRARS
jgi:hypothetical protein